MEELLALYPASLVENSVAGYSFERCRDDYRLGLLASRFIPLIGIQGVEALEPPLKKASTEDKRAFDELLMAAGNADRDVGRAQYHGRDGRERRRAPGRLTWRARLAARS